MSKSKIEWTDRTWNPVTGCTKVSQGCKNCYAERMYERFNGPGSFRNVICHPERLDMPWHWKKPSMVFVNSMSDLFHEDVPITFIDKVFTIMAYTPQHTYQILTKRAERMRDYFNGRLENLEEGIINAREEMRMLTAGLSANEIAYDIKRGLKNVWLGVSVEDQKTADERIPLLMKVPAAVRFLSCEPLLGQINLSIRASSCGYYEPLHHHPISSPNGPFISWVICGGESGPGPGQCIRIGQDLFVINAQLQVCLSSLSNGVNGFQ